MSRAGQSTTCGVCGETIETPARPILSRVVLTPRYGPVRQDVGSVIDLDAHWRDYEQHYAQRHPGVELPARLW